MTKSLLSYCFSLLFPMMGLAQQITPLAQKEDISFRGLANYQDHCIWVSGSKGTVGCSTDSGKTWRWVSPAGYADFDFRDIEVFNENEALIVSAGTPAVILRTADGGNSWSEIYRDERPAIFLDGVDFYESEGYIIGDPIDGNFQLLHSKDSGHTWVDISERALLKAETGEAAFAASGSSIKYIPPYIWLGTGGVIAHVHRLNTKSQHLNQIPLVAIQQGESSQGVFAVDFYDSKLGVAVGGNYMQDQNQKQAVLLTHDGGLTWKEPQSPVGGYRSCVKYITKNLLVATGTSGTDISVDGGQHWKTISTESYNTLVKTASGEKVYLTGSAGTIAVLDLTHLRDFPSEN